MDSDSENDEPMTHYEILGVDEQVSQDALVGAYRQRALELHPDKGGDASLFDDLVKAFKVLSVLANRDAYDEELSKSRERNRLVERVRPARGSGKTVASTTKTKQAEAPMREKTMPHAGSVRQGKMRSTEPGKLGHCANEWKGMGSAGHYLRAITDQVTEEQLTERLFEKYASLPPGKEKKRDWCASLRSKEKANLKALAKQKEQEQKAKWGTWLNTGPCGTGVARRARKKEAATKEKAKKAVAEKADAEKQAAAAAQLSEAAAVAVPDADDAELLAA